jgi:hypothetical protein
MLFVNKVIGTCSDRVRNSPHCVMLASDASADLVTFTRNARFGIRTCTILLTQDLPYFGSVVEIFDLELRDTHIELRLLG